MAKTGSERKLFSSRQRLSNTDDELAVIENGESRASLCEDISERALSSDSHRNSFTGSGAMARLSYFFFTLWNWASHRVHPEVERRDSFLDRFRGPELKETSRESNAQSLGSCDVARKRK
ncbi:cyclic nucleotide-gated channel cone photoreceptor subunit alpha-like [Notothenia coriiceps]|uniref:Cyclic nucleotide-gated channel cone photoreceptor subunit alpha-like n=1 Tax=Notothenia coriiceps TaxID=8208 RepID=A0A6I9N648_9TELE|nr:PREDICTED: cyclic nucleotide-gated channel cone photoreceptor subunit alpha-like [Notothenia coriiceps]